MPTCRVARGLRAAGRALRSWRWLGTIALMAAVLSASASPVQGEARRVWLEGPESSGQELVYTLQVDDVSDVIAVEADLLFVEGIPDDAQVSATELLEGFLLADSVVGDEVLIALAGSEASSGGGAIVEIAVPDPGTPPEVGLARVTLNGGKIPVEYERVVAAFGPGDFNGDDTVGFDDFFLFADHFGLDQADPGFDPLYDMDSSGDVAFDDFFAFADVFGITY